MAIINTYPTATPKGADLLIGTQVKDDTVTENSTKSFTVDEMRSFIAGSGVVQANVTLTSTQVLSFNGGETIELIEAPGANKVIVPVSITCFLDFGTTAYNLNEDLAFQLGTTSMGMKLDDSKVNSTADAYFFINTDGTVNPSLAVNSALNLFGDVSATVTTGDSPLKINIAYRIVDFS